MIKKYTVERGQQILISLLKQSGIKKIVASPGTTNMTFVASVMNDPWFEIISSADERSAAYIACGIAEETGEKVVISCTGATASRNYLPAMTEAHYRKLPILAVTATQNLNLVGHLVPQVLDRSCQLSDTYVHVEHISVPRTEFDEWDATIRLNRALLALSKNGGGPVLINLATNYNGDFSVEELPKALLIKRYYAYDSLPSIPAGRIGIRVGNHHLWTNELTEAVDKFCEKYGAVVFCEHGSNYAGRFRVYNALLNQQPCGKETFDCDLLIHIGETGAYAIDATWGAKQSWRVSEDGELRDLIRKLTNVFEMRELDFFTKYISMPDDFANSRNHEWIKLCREEDAKLKEMLASKELPFSNLWIAQQTSHRLPENSVLHVAILHSQRCWTMFDTPKSVQGRSFVNTGGFGIDGCMSTMIGGALAVPEKLHFLIIGDLAFFYDLNSLGNRHIGKNLRIMLINNGRGTEFRNFGHPAYKFGEDADPFIAAAHHYGDKNPNLVKHYAEDLGFKYLSASSKEEYLNALNEFLSPESVQSSIIFEVFTDSKDESDALEIAGLLLKKTTLRDKIKEALPDPIVDIVRKVKNR